LNAQSISCYVISMNTNKQHSLNYHRTTSFTIALVLHVLIITAFMLFKERNPILTTFDPSKVYPVQFKSKENAPSTAVPRQRKKEVIGSLTGVTSSSLSETGPEKISGDGTGEEVGRSGELLETVKGKSSFDKSVLYYEAPEYPQQARAQRLEGEVTLRVKVTPEGIPMQPEIISSSGHQTLDQAAFNASLKWRFHKRKTPDFVLLDKTIVFKLNP